MWSIVVFKDKTIEAVPSFWVSKNVCAWPKKNPRKFILKQIKPNKSDFIYVTARKIGINYETYSEARSKVQKGQVTSNLSSADNDYEITKKRKIQKITVTKNDSSLWSPASCSSSSSGHMDDSECSDLSANVSDKNSIKTGVQIRSASDSRVGLKRQLDSSESFVNFSQSTNKLADKLSEGVQIRSANDSFVGFKRQLDFDNTTSKRVHSTTLAKPLEEEGIVLTTSSPFKVISELVNENKTSPVQTSFIESEQSARDDYSKMLDIVTKINRTCLNTWYEVKTLNERFDKLETSMMTNSYSSYVNDNPNIDTGFDDVSFNLPICKEENLADFEEKLTDFAFKSKVIRELSRLIRSSLPSTVRGVMRYLFHDCLLSHYSYKGREKKKDFSTLNCCTVIFESIKKMAKFKNYSHMDVEGAIKVFIAGAKFRLATKKTIIEDHNKQQF